MSYDGPFIAASGAAALFGAYLGVAQIVDPPSPSMSLASLSYEAGQVRQYIRVTGGPVQARWAAMVRRGGDVLCAGDGASTYEGEPVAMAPDLWTGADCPDLQPGDRLVASWSYDLPDGTVAVITGQHMVQ